MQLLPLAELTPFIKHYLFLERNEAAFTKLRLFSDANPGMVFTLHGSLSTNFPSIALPNAFLYGQIHGFKDIYSAGQMHIIIVVFHPYGLHHFLGIPAHELQDQIISLQEVWGSQAVELHEQLADTETIPARYHLLNHFFARFLWTLSTPSQPLIEASVRFILKNKGLVSAGQLVRFTGYTERHLERKFAECIGLTPKKFGTIVRLHTSLRQIRTSCEHLTAIAYDRGYADQSHLNKDFKKYTGLTPLEYNQKTSLAINFLEA